MCDWIEAIIRWWFPEDCSLIDTTTYQGWMAYERCLNG